MFVVNAVLGLNGARTSSM